MVDEEFVTALDQPVLAESIHAVRAAVGRRAPHTFELDRVGDARLAAVERDTRRQRREINGRPAGHLFRLLIHFVVLVDRLPADDCTEKWPMSFIV